MAEAHGAYPRLHGSYPRLHGACIHAPVNKCVRAYMQDSTGPIQEAARRPRARRPRGLSKAPRGLYTCACTARSARRRSCGSMPAPASHDQKLQVVPAMRVVKTQQQLMTTHACKSRCGERASAHCRTNAKTGPIQDPTGPIQEAARRLRGRRPRGLSKASRPARSGLRGRYPCSMHHCAKGSAKDLDVEARRSRRVRCRVVQGLATAANGIAKTRKGCEDACNVEASTPRFERLSCILSR